MPDVLALLYSKWDVESVLPYLEKLQGESWKIIARRG